MSLVGILIVIVVVGAIAYIIKIAPIDTLWKNVAYVVLAVFVIIWLLKQLGALGLDLKI